MNYIVNVYTSGRIKKETFTEPAKAEQFQILMTSMGYKCSMKTKTALPITRNNIKIVKG